MKQTEQEIIDLFGNELYVIRLGFSAQFKLLLEKIEKMENAYKKLCRTLDMKPSSNQENSPVIKFPLTSTQYQEVNK